ncbi:hypothetical protein EAS56_18370 [Bradyrhizobium guangzhouense]|uniref:Uncharacterized protein n=1 Tax=Bradyrhizobium guangzhouense TaxID=1325095 RepID=A0ABY0E4H3_9BRAD|nr:hypothetical protein [Bradyrhizobium guangzhouense]RXH12061.1 hypothetical protein EAS56_18370 [Bradyrhizobium guangzhouense]
MELIGHPPELAGLLCEAFICEGCVCKGEIVAGANVFYLCFAGTWHRLAIDCGVIFWWPVLEEPGPWKIASEGWEYPHIDLGAAAGVVGHRLREYRMEIVAAGGSVIFHFDNDRTIAIDNENDASHFRIG